MVFLWELWNLYSWICFMCITYIWNWFNFLICFYGLSHISPFFFCEKQWTGQLPWRGYEIKNLLDELLRKSWHSPSNHSWCERACFDRVWHPCIIFLLPPCNDMSLIFTVLVCMCIISECSVYSLAWFMSNRETSFVTLGRVLAYPLKLVVLILYPFFYVLISWMLGIYFLWINFVNLYLVYTFILIILILVPRKIRFVVMKKKLIYHFSLGAHLSIIISVKLTIVHYVSLLYILTIQISILCEDLCWLLIQWFIGWLFFVASEAILFKLRSMFSVAITCFINTLVALLNVFANLKALNVLCLLVVLVYEQVKLWTSWNIPPKYLYYLVSQGYICKYWC